VIQFTDIRLQTRRGKTLPILDGSNNSA